MSSIVPLLLMIGSFVAGFLIALIVQFAIVPSIARLLGERHFASDSAFDGCTLGIFGGLVAVASPILWTGKRPILHGSPLWIFPVLAVGLTLYGLLFLWFHGMGGRGREWKIVDGRILGKTKQELHPTFMRERSEYNQTDAYHGYSHRFLELHSNSELLGTNAYNSEDEFKRDVKRVHEITNAKRLDLVWCWRAEERKWSVAYFPDEWTPILCGCLDRLTEEDRQWWQGWIYPGFADRIETEVDAPDASKRVERLREAYAKEMQNSNPNVAEFADQLQRLLRSEGPVIAWNQAGFDEQVGEIRGDASMLLHDGDFAELIL